MKRFPLLLLLILAGCLGPVRPPAGPVVPPPPGAPAPAVPPPAAGAPLGVLWSARTGQSALEVAQFLDAHPDLKLGVVFPDRFFGEEPDAVKAKALFETLVSRGQVEVLLSIPARPVLALIHDSDSARLSSTTASVPLPPRFQWPEDAAGQVALARSAHRRRWRSAPEGLEVPWGAVVGPELEPLSRQGFKWFYAGSKGKPGFYDASGAMVAVAAPFPVDAAGRRAWLPDNLVAGERPHFRAFVQADAADTAGLLKTFAALADAAAAAGARWEKPSVAARDLPRPEAAWAPSDLSPWIGEAEENRAWQLLGLARKAVEDFKNSGRAEIRTLDRAVRELYSAESGGVFRALGADGGAAARSSEVKREFLASLEQAFRFLGVPAPGALAQGFSGGDLDSAGTAEPFFRRDGEALLWRDADKDDRGPGDFFYPTGAPPAGSWDLKRFRAEARGAEVLFRWELAATANPGRAPYGFSLAVIDTYIDINHLPGAGAETLLPGRPGLVESQNGWEYALSVDGWGARLYQPGTGGRSASAGGGARRVATFPAQLVNGGVEVAVPRKYLRGEPSSWGFAVAVLGRSASSPDGGEPVPMSVGDQPGPDRFGGAAAGRTAPPYVDLLTEGPIQNEVLGAYKQGREAVLPFVRSDEVTP